LITAILVGLADTTRAQIPTINVDKTCRAAGGAAVSLMGRSTTEQDVQMCLDSEQKAREQIIKDPATYSVADKKQWLISIARFKALSARRRRADVELDEKIEATVADTANDPEAALQERNRGELLRQALTRLSSKHRGIIDLVYYHEKSIDECAQVLGIPAATEPRITGLSHFGRPSGRPEHRDILPS